VSVLVVDASVVVEWFVPEIHGDAARRLLSGPHRYFSPDLLFPEVGHGSWKKVRRGDLTGEDARPPGPDVPMNFPGLKFVRSAG
jgi:predicted nucleic acid-binding protein